MQYNKSKAVRAETAMSTEQTAETETSNTIAAICGSWLADDDNELQHNARSSTQLILLWLTEFISVSHSSNMNII